MEAAGVVSQATTDTMGASTLTITEMSSNTLKTLTTVRTWFLILPCNKKTGYFGLDLQNCSTSLLKEIM